MGKSKWLLFICSILLVPVTQAQVNRYMVFFEDKDDSPFSLSNPEDYLSPRALENRDRQGIEIDERDLPVNPVYVDELESIGVEVFHTTKWFNGALIQESASTISEVQALPFVTSVELVAPGERLEKTKSGRKLPTIGRIKRSKATSAQNQLISVDDMHQLNYKGQGMLVAVFDGGFENVDQATAFAHIFDEERMVATHDFVTSSDNVYQFDDHGTRVFSTLGGFEESSFIGTVYEADFVLCVTEDVSSEFRIEEYNWLFAAEFADSLGVDVINTSLGFNLFDDPSMDYSVEDLDGETAVITRASNIAGEKGILLVASAGNEGNNSWGTITPPADSPYVLTVGSITSDLELSGFSSTGPTADERIKPDVVTLGNSVTLIGSAGNVVTGSGTSFSSPQVAGLATGVWQADRSLTNTEVIEAIRRSGSQADAPDNFLGYGVPDFIEAADNPVLSVEDIFENKIKVYPNPFRGNKFYIDLNSKYSGDGIEIRLYDLLGNLLAEEKFTAVPDQAVIEFNIEADLTAGTYLLRLFSRKEVTEVKLLKF